MEAALSAQRDFMDTYGEPLEQLLNVLVYLVPVQDSEDDIAGFWNQTVYSVIDLFGLYRTVLLRSPDALPVSVAESGTSGHPGGGIQRARLTYTIAAFSLRSLRSVQVLLEMYAYRVGGAKMAMRVCFRVEVVKLMLKLLLRSRMPFAFYIDEEALEEVEPPKANPALAAAQPTKIRAVPGADDVFVGKRSGRKLPALPSPMAPARILPGDTSAPSLRAMIGEVIFHARPLVHLMVLSRRGRKSWVAWFTAIFLDQASLVLLTPVLEPRAGSRAASLELAEMKRRQNLLWWALLRSPFFDKFLRRPSELLDRILSRVPVINLFRIMELLLALQKFHFTTSAS